MTRLFQFVYRNTHHRKYDFINLQMLQVLIIEFCNFSEKSFPLMSITISAKDEQGQKETIHAAYYARCDIYQISKCAGMSSWCNS